MTLLGKLVLPDKLPAHTKKMAISSPLSGSVVPLDNVPHELFQQRLFGEGIAITPSGYQLFSPFSGTVLAFPETAHQIRIKASNGLQIQIQLGIDSHLMMGEGFKRKVRIGMKIKTGDLLAEFSLAKMKQSLPSILCPITILNSEKVKGIQGHYYSVMAKEDSVMTVYI